LKKTYVLGAQVDGRRGKPPLGHLDGQVGEERELVFFLEHLFRLGYSNLVLQRFETGAGDVNVEERGVDIFGELGTECGRVPEV